MKPPSSNTHGCPKRSTGKCSQASSPTGQKYCKTHQVCCRKEGCNFRHLKTEKCAKCEQERIAKLEEAEAKKKAEKEEKEQKKRELAEKQSEKDKAPLTKKGKKV